MSEHPVPPGPRAGAADEPRPADVASAVLRHPAVIRLDGGPFGSIASYLSLIHI